MSKRDNIPIADILTGIGTKSIPVLVTESCSPTVNSGASTNAKSSTSSPHNWVNAPIFVPNRKTGLIGDDRSDCFFEGFHDLPRKAGRGIEMNNPSAFVEDAKTKSCGELSDDISSHKIETPVLAPTGSTDELFAFKSLNCPHGSHCDDSVSPEPSDKCGANGKAPPTDSWINAPIFVPSRDAELEIASTNELINSSTGNTTSMGSLCPFENPYLQRPHCVYNRRMELCEMCNKYCLHPNDIEQRRNHHRKCVQQHEEAMELSFAIARSSNKTCDICFEIVMEKACHEKRFGIMSHCNHVFCLQCIRTWRRSQDFEHKTTKSCPLCRVSSDFICPSAYWVETQEQKDQLFSDYLSALKNTDCKYFSKGYGICPFGNKCFYKHALENGTLINVGNPRREHERDTVFYMQNNIYGYEYVPHN